MPDLKAAAERLRAEAKAASKALETVARSGEPHDQCKRERDDFLLAAQALEAWAWQQETGAKVRECWTGHRWFCEVADGEYVADTPLGAVLAAMEGDRHD